MSLGEMLVALHNGAQFETCHARVRMFTDLDGIREWNRELIERANRGDGGVRMTNVTMTASSGRREPLQVENELWLDLITEPSRWRVDAPDVVHMVQGQEMIAWTGSDGRRTERESGGSRIPHPAALFMDVSYLVHQCRFDDPVTDELAGRVCWYARARSRTTHPSRHSGFFMHRLAGDEGELWLDQQTGSLLRWVGRFEGEVISELDCEQIEFDIAIDDAVFEWTPPDGVARTQHDENLHRLAEMGIELESDDPYSARIALNDAMRALQEPVFGTPGPGWDDQPSDPPPDAEDAIIDVGLAFARAAQVSDDDSDALEYVEPGRGLAEPYARARRLAGAPDDCLKVYTVSFVDHDHARVRFDTDAGRLGILRGLTGEAIRTADGWKVARQTLAALLLRAGIVVPPP